MLDRPLVSLIVPVFNGQQFLKITLDSILSQDYPNIEVIAVDDGSTDDSAQIVRSYSGRVQLLRQPNQGQAQALNTGFSKARGKYLGYLSADDVIDPGCVGLMVAALEANQCLQGAYPSFDLMDHSGNRFSLGRGEPFEREVCLRHLKCPVGPGLLFRASAFLQYGGWDTDFRQLPDLEYLLRISQSSAIQFIPARLAAFRVHDQSQTFAKASKQKADEPVLLIKKLTISNTLNINNRSIGLAYACLHSSRLHARAQRYPTFIVRLGQAIRYHPMILFDRSLFRLTLNGLFGRMKDKIYMRLKKSK